MKNQNFTRLYTCECCGETVPFESTHIGAYADRVCELCYELDREEFRWYSFPEQPRYPAPAMPAATKERF